MTQFGTVQAVHEHMDDQDLVVVPTQDRRGNYWLLAYSGSDGERLFYQGIPEGDEDGNVINDAKGWLVDGAISNGPSWPLHLLEPADDPADSEPCTSEFWSWDYFRHGQTDPYWMKCDILGPHEEHENSETGAKWPNISSPADKREGEN